MEDFYICLFNVRHTLFNIDAGQVLEKKQYYILRLT